jgi:hypothetical protein
VGGLDYRQSASIGFDRLESASINLDWLRLTHRGNVAPGERGAFSLKPTAKSVV